MPETGEPIRSAMLRVRVADDADAGGDGEIGAWAVNAGWDEGGIAWPTRPAVVGARIGRATAAGPGDWVEIDVSKLVTGPGQHALVLKSRGRDAVRVWSREGAEPPRLLLTTGDHGSFARGRRDGEPHEKAENRRGRSGKERGGEDRGDERDDRQRDRRDRRG